MARNKRSDPSLLRFVLTRLDEDDHLIIGNTPFMGSDVVDSAFHDLFLHRRALIDRGRRDREAIVACVNAMRDVQGPAPVPIPTVSHLVTVLGSQIIKLIASRYEDHPEYDEAWRPEE